MLQDPESVGDTSPCLLLCSQSCVELSWCWSCHRPTYFFSPGPGCLQSWRNPNLASNLLFWHCEMPPYICQQCRTACLALIYRGHLGRMEIDNWTTWTKWTKSFYLMSVGNVQAMEEMHGGWNEVFSSDPFSVQKWSSLRKIALVQTIWIRYYH